MAVNYRGKKFYNIGPWHLTLATTAPTTTATTPIGTEKVKANGRYAFWTVREKVRMPISKGE